MGDQYKSCEMHGKPFPQNMVDTEKIDVMRVYVEKKEDIEGKSVNTTLFMGSKTENEGFDVCDTHLQEKILNIISENGSSPIFKVVTWNKETMQKKDGSGSYEKNVKSIHSVDEYREKIKADKKKGV